MTYSKYPKGFGQGRKKEQLSGCSIEKDSLHDRLVSRVEKGSQINLFVGDGPGYANRDSFLTMFGKEIF